MTSKTYDKLKQAARFWLLRRTPACQNIVDTISQSMERPLRFRERLMLKLHLWVCAWCQWYLDHLALIRKAARGRTDEAPLQISGPSLSDEARERIRRNLANSN